MRRFASLFAVLVLLVTGCTASVGCCGKSVGFRSPFSVGDSAPEVVPIAWGVVQPVKPSIVAVPQPTGVTFGGAGCEPAGTAPIGGVYTPGHTWQAPPGK